MINICLPLIADNMIVDKLSKTDVKYELEIFCDGVVVGTLIIKLKYVDENIVEIGYQIDKQYRHKGYATKSVQLLVTHLLDTNDNLRVLASVDHDNISSNRVLKKCGFTEINKIELSNNIIIVYEKRN